MPKGAILGFLRALALIAVMAGAVGSEGLMLRAGRQSPRLLIVLFTIWVLSPFVALGWANVVSKHWSALTRATLYGITLVVAAGSWAIYAHPILVAPPGSANAFVWVAVPPASWLLMTVVTLIAAFVSGRQSRRGAGA